MIVQGAAVYINVGTGVEELAEQVHCSTGSASFLRDANDSDSAAVSLSRSQMEGLGGTAVFCILVLEQPREAQAAVLESNTSADATVREAPATQRIPFQPYQKSTESLRCSIPQKGC